MKNHSLLNRNMDHVIVASLVLIAFIMFTFAQIAQASLVSGQDIIPAPASVADDAPGAENEHQQAFDEAQGVTLPVDIQCDNNTTVLAGTKVNSHMIFLNTAGTEFVADSNVVWAFDGKIICVMSDSTGTLEAASNVVLGAPGTAYPGSFPARGMEGGDSYTVLDDEISVTMQVTEPGDWIRVVTEWVDTVPPRVSCVETVNPHGKTKPNAPGTGQNEDGFYQLLAADQDGEDVQIFVVDSESGMIFGSFASGTNMKYVEANGATPRATEMGGNNGKGNGSANSVDVQIIANGDALVYAVDAAGNVSEMAECLVPNPPK